MNMKLTKKEFTRSREESELELFLQGIRADETRAKYKRTLERILCEILEDFFEGTFEERVKQFVKHAKNDPDWTQDLLLQFSKKLRQRTGLDEISPDYLNPSTFPNYFKPIKNCWI